MLTGMENRIRRNFMTIELANALKRNQSVLLQNWKAFAKLQAAYERGIINQRQINAILKKLGEQNDAE